MYRCHLFVVNMSLERKNKKRKMTKCWFCFRTKSKGSSSWLNCSRQAQISKADNQEQVSASIWHLPFHQQTGENGLWNYITSDVQKKTCARLVFEPATPGFAVRHAANRQNKSQFQIQNQSAWDFRFQ